MIAKALKCLILSALFISTTYSQELVPPIQNFSPSEYLAASQNWDIAVDDRGVIYSANNQGLLVYDGINWDLFTLESQSIIRSVYPYKNRIYTGSYKEFGYWETMPDGHMEYNSLTHLLTDFDMQSDEFWEIIEYKGAIYFRSFGAIYKYENDRITRAQEVVSTALGIYKNNLIFSPRKNGLFYLDKDGNSRPLEGDFSALNEINIRDIEAHGENLYIAGKESLFLYMNKQLQKINNKELNDHLKRSELNHILSISEDEIILGTIKDGIIQFNLTDNSINIFNRTSGLQNNTILGMAYSKDKLWLALDKGVDLIDLHAPIQFFTDNSGELGAVYDIHNFKNNHFLASNTGVYSFSDNKLELIENGGDHTWNLEEFDDVLYANHNTGIYEIIGNDFVPIDTRTGSFSINKINSSSGELLISHYTGLSLYNTKLDSLKELEGINFPVKKLIIENDQTVWAAHPYEGIYKISHNNFEDIQVQKIRALSDKENFNAKIYKLNNQIVTYINGYWYKYNPFQNDFQPFEELEDFNGFSLIYQDSNFYVFAESDLGNLIITNLDDQRISINAKELNHRLVKYNENFIRQNDSIFYITLNDGFARLNLNKLQRAKTNQWISEPYIKEFSDEEQNYILAEAPVIPYKGSRSITIKAGMPLSRAIKLNYSLKGEESLSGSVESGVINFRNLEHGDYKLQLSAVGSGLNEIVTKNFEFSIAPPWYLSIQMKIVYTLLVLSLVFLIYWLNQQKLKKHQLQLEAKFEKEHAERLNRLEKDRLINEIDLKRKELANTTMMAAKKNEVLMEIQGELNKDKNKFSNQFRLKHIMNKINNAVKNKDEWKVFETNFNEVHEDFFKDILARYPKLTSKDLKLCSYLKMNLSSKEIAPLMGISVRGVEVHRYRLRKKMELDSDVNLTKFLIKNF